MVRDSGKGSTAIVENVERKVTNVFSRISNAKKELFVKMSILVVCCMVG